MSITPAFLDELRSRVPISSVVGRFVSWDQRKSQPAKGDFWAPCPFHSEKTASFHVQDPKGFYYCFGCHNKGDAIGFLKEKSNMSFVEAVRELAGMAGMQMPEYRPENKEKQDANARLIEMHEDAKKFFALNLSAAAGTMARDYLSGARRLSEATIKEFHIGYAPNSRDALLTHLKEKGYSEDEMALSGLVIKPDDGGQVYDRFRNRIMFPITDLRGRTVAFGGRAMEANARAKYLNSPESPIFHKSNIVYNLSNARNHVKGDAHIIISEGYMDVVAMAQAGIKSAVAPMGTAVTMEQVEAIWRIDPRPVAAMDGDTAGQRAAKKLSQLALPHISAEKTLGFVLMPEGQDPDDYINANGAPAMLELLASYMPMVEMLWRGALEDKRDDTPEARAGFDKSLRGLLKSINDPALRKHYGDDFAGRRQVLFAPKSTAPARAPYDPNYQSQSRQTPYRSNKPAAPTVRPNTQTPHEDDLALALVLKTVLTHPAIAADFMDALAELPSQDIALHELRKSVLMCYDDTPAIAELAKSDKTQTLARFKRLDGLNLTKSSTPEGEVRTTLQHEITRIRQVKSLSQEINEIRTRISQEGVSEELSDLLSQTMNERERMRQERVNDRIETSDSASFLRDFLESEAWRK